MKHKNIFAISTIAISILLASPSFAFERDEMGDRGFAKVDTNNDGIITLEEARLAHASVFAKMDANRDNFLTRDEIRNFHDAQRQEMQTDMQNDHFKRMDIDNNGNISKSEFDNAHRLMQAQRQEKMKDRMEKMRINRFDAFDKNKDGSVSRDEMLSEGQLGMRPDGPRGMRPDGRAMRPDGPPPPRRNPDTDGDGKISKAEWNAMELPIFGKADVNKDNRVTKEEAANAMRNQFKHDRFKPR